MSATATPAINWSGNKKKAAMFGAAGAGAGFLITKYAMKSSKKTVMITTIALAIVGLAVGYKQPA